MRRLCVLQERGDVAAADVLANGPLAELIASARGSTANPAEFDQNLATLFTTEEERVANAAVLAELLLPTLTSGTPLWGETLVAAPSAPSGKLPSPPPPAPVRRAPGDIADFLDDMIAQEQAEAAPRDRPRRAS